MPEKKIYRLDASLMKQSHCMRKVWHIMYDGFTGKINPVDIEYGVAFHIFAKKFYDTEDKDTRFGIAAREGAKYFTETPHIPKPKKPWMNVSHLKKTCFDWYQHWENNRDELEPLKVEGASTTELKFSIPYLITPEYDILLEGTIDKLTKIKGGCYAIVDYKTTSSWDTKGYLEDYKLDLQLMFYRFIISLYAELYPQSIYADMVRKGCGACIEGIFVNGDKDAIIQRSDVFFYKEWQMVEFKRTLDLLCQEILVALQTYETKQIIPDRQGVYRGTCQTKYGGTCQFGDACGAPDQIAGQFILKRNFVQKPYEPLKFH